MDELEAKLKEAQACRHRMIATDGVFSMDGDVAKLREICDLAEKYDALVMVDDSHAVGFWGANGRGTHEYCGVMDRVDILTGTFGKALGGASGGYTSGRKEIVELLRQRSRPYLFSNTVAPVIAAATVKAIDLLMTSTALRDRLEANTRCFRKEIAELGFEIKPGSHPIVPIMLGDAKLAQEMAAMLLEEGIYVIGFSYPVVPMGQARIRVQLSALHTDKDLAFAIEQFKAAKVQYLNKE
jgi:glycine C-acetyltransferase